MSLTVPAEYVGGPGDGQRHMVPLDEFATPPLVRPVVVSAGLRMRHGGEPADVRAGQYVLVRDPVTYAVLRADDGSVRYQWGGYLPKFPDGR